MHIFPRGYAWRWLQVSSQAELPHFFVDICGTVFEQITSFAVPEVFSKGFNLSFPPSAVAAVLGPRVAGNTQGPRFLMQVQAVAPKSCVLPVPLLRSHIPRCLGTQDTLCLQWLSPLLIVSHTGPRTAVGTWQCTGPAPANRCSGTQGYPRPCREAHSHLGSPVPATFHPTRNFRPRRPPARRSHVPMSPRGSATLPCHAGHLLAGGLAALDPRSASQATTSTLLLCKESGLLHG